MLSRGTEPTWHGPRPQPKAAPGHDCRAPHECRKLAPMDAREDDDAALMLAYAGGDARAFETLYARHRGHLYSFIMHRVSDRGRADELFQETWSRVIKARQRYRPQAKFSTWLLQIAHNLVVDSYRRARPQAGAEETERVFESRAAPEHEQPERVLGDFQQRRRLQIAIEQLADEQRAVFLLRMQQELSLEEIASITGVGRETAKSRLRYARARIREHFRP